MAQQHGGKEGGKDGDVVESIFVEHEHIRKHDHEGLSRLLGHMNAVGNVQPILSRIVFAGRRTSKDESLRGMFEQLIRAMKEAQFTGLLVETPSNFLHYLEGESKHLFEVAKRVHDHVKKGEVMEDVQVLHYTDDISDRKFPKWTAMDVNLPGTPAPNSEDEMAHAIVKQIRSLQDLGAQIFTKERLQIETYLASIRSSKPDMLPTIALIDSFLDSGYCLSVEEWNAIFHTPVDITLDYELVWPIPPPLKY